MIYACDHCHFLFSRTSPVQQCPDCGKENIRPATPEEIQEFEADNIRSLGGEHVSEPV